MALIQPVQVTLNIINHRHPHLPSCHPSRIIPVKHLSKPANGDPPVRANPTSRGTGDEAICQESLPAALVGGKNDLSDDTRPRSPGFRIIDDSPEQDTGLSPSAYITPVTGEIPQGAKLPVVASAPPPTVVPNLPTRVAFLTPDGLKVFVEGSVDGENLSDPLEARLKPEKKGNWSTDYAYFEDDFDKFIDHIRPRFRLLNDPSLAQLPLEEQVKTYLTRPPDDPAGTQVRLLILDGHNGRESASFRIKRNATFRWKNFHNLKVPPQVTVVVTLACCYAATPIEEFILGSGIPKIIALAACDRNETSNADEFKANRFLDALFELLEHGGSERCFDEWEKFLAAVVNNLTKFGTRDQHPVAYIRSEQTPAAIFRSLIMRPAITSGRGRMRPVEES